VALPQAQQRRHKIRPGVECVPAGRNRLAVGVREPRDAGLTEQLVQYLAMDIVDVEARIDRAQHTPQRAAAILVGKLVPILPGIVPAAALGERGSDTAVPVENRAAGIKSHRLEPVHRDLLQPALRTRAAGTMKLATISLRRSSSLA